MPSCSDPGLYPTREIQKGLKTLARERSWSVDPGATDGLWGPATRTALRNLLMAQACPPEDIRLFNDLWDRTPARSIEVLAPMALTEALILPAARRWRAEVPTGAPSSVEPAPAEVALPGVTTPVRRTRPAEAGPVENGNAITQTGARFGKWAWWAAGISAIVGVVGLIWWYQRKRRK